MTHTDQGLTRTEVKSGWVWTISSWRGQRTLQHAKAVLNCLDFQSGAVFSAMVVKGGDPYALAVVLEAIKFTGSTRLIIMSGSETAEHMILQSSTHRKDRVPVQEESSEQTMRSRNRSER